MQRFTRSCLFATWIALALGTAVRAQEYRSARVSDVRGNLSVRGAEDDDFSYIERNAVIRHEDTLWTDDDGRAEIELERGSWVRLAEDTKLEVRALPPSAEFRIWNGSVFLDLSDRLEGRTLLKTPVGDVQIEPDSVVRVDLDKSESARVSVFNGRARAFPDSGSAVSLGPGERLYLDAGREAPDPTRFDRGEQDGFDRYHRERVDYFINRPVPRELSSDLIGARELGDYGSWVSVENVTYWRPRCEPTWRPYSSGYWSYVNGFGYSWVDYSPWGYTTSHYGRWLYRPTYGWLWAPGYAWAPSYVYWSNYGNYCGWAPLDPWNRPCYFGGGNGFSFAFGTGNFFVDFRSWTFCDRNRFYYGRHHRNFGGRSFFAGHEINLRPDGFRPFRDAHRELGIPRNSVRGVTVSDRGVLARDRVLQLENRVPQGRQRLIEDRFKVVASRDRDLLKRGSDVERLQRDRGTTIDPSRLLRGDEAEKRLRRSPGGGDSREVRDRRPGEDRPGEGRPEGRPSDDRVTRNPGDRQPRDRDQRPDGKPGDSQADARDRDGRDSGFRRGEPGNRRDGEGRRDGDAGRNEPGRTGETGRGNTGNPGGDRDRGPDAGRPDAGRPDAGRPDTGRPDASRPGDRADRTPSERPGDRDSNFRRGEGRRAEDRPNDPARPTNPSRNDSPARPEGPSRNEGPSRPEGPSRNEGPSRREPAQPETPRREPERNGGDRGGSDRRPGSRSGAFQDLTPSNPATRPDATRPDATRPGSEDRFRRSTETPSGSSYRDYRFTPRQTPGSSPSNRDSTYRRTVPSDSSPGRSTPSSPGAGNRTTPDSGSYSRPGYDRRSGSDAYRGYNLPSRSGSSYGDRSPGPGSPGSSSPYGRSYSSPAPSRSYSSPAPSGGYSRGSGSYSPRSTPSGGSGYSGGSGSRSYSSPSTGSSSGSRGSYSGGSSSGGSSSGGRGGFSGGGFRR